MSKRQDLHLKVCGVCCFFSADGQENQNEAIIVVIIIVFEKNKSIVYQTGMNSNALRNY